MLQERAPHDVNIMLNQQNYVDRLNPGQEHVD
jgi:hypothetical protein